MADGTDGAEGADISSAAAVELGASNFAVGRELRGIETDASGGMEGDGEGGRAGGADRTERF